MDCCDPVWHQTPSGAKWYHRRDCPEHAGEFIRRVGEATINRSMDTIARKHRLVTAQAGVPTRSIHSRTRLRADEPHPACEVAWADDGNACSRCTPLLCNDPGCQHEACAKDRWESQWA